MLPNLYLRGDVIERRQNVKCLFIDDNLNWHVHIARVKYRRSAHTDAAQNLLKASALTHYIVRHGDDLVGEAVLEVCCVYVHAGLYRFLNVPLAYRYPVIP